MERAGLYDPNPHGPIKLVYEGSRDEERSGEATRAEELTVAFLAVQADQSSTSAAIDAHLRSSGVSERTAQRARKGLKGAGRLEPARRGLWRLVSRPPLTSVA